MDPRSSLLKQKRDEMASRRFCDLILDSGPKIYDNTFLSWPKKVSYFWSLDKKKNRRRGGGGGGGGGEKTNKKRDANIWRANVEGSHERSWMVKKKGSESQGHNFEF